MLKISNSDTLEEQDSNQESFAWLTATALCQHELRTLTKSKEATIEQFINGTGKGDADALVDDAKYDVASPPYAKNRHIQIRFNQGKGEPVNSIVCPFDNAVHYDAGQELSILSSRTLARSSSIFSQDFAELSFLCRVLSVALNPETLLMERYKFLCIVSNNLDEQFSKMLDDETDNQVFSEDLELFTGSMRQQVRPKTEYEQRLTTAIQTIVNKQYLCFEKDVRPMLRDEGIEIVDYSMLTMEEKTSMNSYFDLRLRPLLTPIVLDKMRPFPLLHSHTIYLVAKVKSLKNPKQEPDLLILRVPKKDRLVQVSGDSKFVLVEDIIKANISYFCNGVTVVEAFPIRVTRNVKLELENSTLDYEEYGLDFIVDECHRRQAAPVTRLEITPRACQDFVERLRKELTIDELDVYEVQSDILDLGSCFSLVGLVNAPCLSETMKDPVVPPAFKGLLERVASRPEKIFEKIAKQDVLVEYPRESFEHSLVLFLQAAARDPRVKSLHTVLYRTGNNSPVVGALIRAAKNAKQVFVLVELKASFDEVTNSTIARDLKEAGCNIIYGVPGMKVHSKIALVVREEGNNLVYYSNIATGNYNAKTAKMYTDLSLFTRRQDIGKDISDVFVKIHTYSITKSLNFDNLKCLLVAPSSMKRRFTELIRIEAEHAKQGRAARIVAQVNGLTDRDIVEELYNASQEGVKIDLIVRGLCRLRPEIKGKSENIRVYSWIGHVLQHRRVFFFSHGGNGNDRFFIGSADLRTRNLNERIEVVVPISKDNRAICKRLSRLFDIVKQRKFVWRMSWDGRYYQGLPKSNPPSFTGAFEKVEPPTESNEEQERAPKVTINIQGENITVDKVSVGAVPYQVKCAANGDVQYVEFLMVTTKSNQFQKEDVWSFPKGGANETMDLTTQCVRVAKDKAGVLNSRGIVNLGWIQRTSTQKGKTSGVHTVLLEVIDTGRIPQHSNKERIKKWCQLDEAMDKAMKSGNDFAQSALKLAVEALCRRGIINRGSVAPEFITSDTSNHTPSPPASIVVNTEEAGAIENQE